jgi:hypothetical protein
MWMKCNDGNYVNLDAQAVLIASGSGTTWTIQAGGNHILNTSAFASEAAAQEAIRKLTQGVDPSTLI